MSNYLKNRLNCFDPNNMNNESCKCSICLNPPSESSIETNCGHFYHQECLDRWFSTINKNICPLCKKEVNYMVNADGKQLAVKICDEYDVETEDEETTYRNHMGYYYIGRRFGIRT